MNTPPISPNINPYDIPHTIPYNPANPFFYPQPGYVYQDPRWIISTTDSSGSISSISTTGATGVLTSGITSGT